MKNFCYIICTLAIVATLTGCVTKPDTSVKNLTKEEYGDQWAFTVDSLTLKCETDAVIAQDGNGNKYYLNGVAKSKYEGNPSFKDIEEIQLEDDVTNEILKKASNGEQFTPLKKSIGFAIEEGLKLCK